jgi:hypothetical protein
MIEETVTARVQEELFHRHRYGQQCECIALGVEAWYEAASIDTLLYNPVTDDEYIVLFMGMKARIDPGLPPTCFEIT